MKVLTLITSALFVFASGANAQSVVKPKTASLETGEQLIAKSDCQGCHRVDGKLLGPSYLEIAQKYSDNNANREILIQKIIHGGSGVWGEIPMSPHPNLDPAEAKLMVKYILALKQTEK